MSSSPVAHLRARSICQHGIVLMLCLFTSALPWPKKESAQTLAAAPAITLFAPIVTSADSPLTPQTVTNLYLPIVLREYPSLSSVNPQDRQASLTFYSQIYLASEGIGVSWTGNHAACDPGTTHQEFRDAVVRRINYFRAMAGVPAEVKLKDEYNHKAQAAALMMSVNNRLSHTPTSDWQCYSSDGAQAAGSSDLYLGVYGPSAITGYMRDPGGGNYFAGHRRWILYPQTQEMGTGDIPPTSYSPANALWVFDSNMWNPRPSTREEFVAWPPPGYVPYQVVFARWSFAYAGADFSAATVTMTANGSGISVSVSTPVNGYGENTLVWIPMGLNDGAGWPKPQADTVYVVNVQNVKINAQDRNFTYTVTVFDPIP